MPATDDCDCEFDAYAGEDSGEESWHYKRTCKHCGCVWYGLHCPHDLCQNACPVCEVKPTPEGTADA
ncbi:hypothetical protein LCGC14_2281710 [marine sediment metagenome]|uniref:Uncharacterized protein n=1 Tax=marine sediment metagenome TaxID=412755 RepID=A0A0F9CUH4_9ZZZZ